MYDTVQTNQNMRNWNGLCLTDFLFIKSDHGNEEKRNPQKGNRKKKIIVFINK